MVVDGWPSFLKNLNYEVLLYYYIIWFKKKKKFENIVFLTFSLYFIGDLKFSASNAQIKKE